MSGFSVLLSKELLELFRSFKVLTILVILLIIGLISPILAKYTPELIKMLGSGNMGGIEILFTQEPTVTDSLFQFHKNLALFPVLIILLVMGTLSGERSRKIATVLLCKPIGRGAYVLAKFLAPSLICALGVIIASAGCYLYTTILFGEVWLLGFIQVAGLFLLFFMFFISLTIALSSYLPTVGTALLSIGVYALLSATVAFPKLAQYTPNGVSMNALNIIKGNDTVGLAMSVILTLCLIVLLLFISHRKITNYEL